MDGHRCKLFFDASIPEPKLYISAFPVDLIPVTDFVLISELISYFWFLLNFRYYTSELIIILSYYRLNIYPMVNNLS